MSNINEDKSTYIGGIALKSGNSSMGIGTDAVMLGMLADINNGGKIADICTGSGVIGIMACRRLLCRNAQAKLIGIDISEPAIATAKENARLALPGGMSEWICGDVRELIHGHPLFAPHSFDLILCNPPYFDPIPEDAFAGSRSKSDSGRKTWRMQSSLNMDDIARAASLLLRRNGEIAIVMPKSLWSKSEVNLWLSGLNLRKLIKVYTKEGRSWQRAIVQLRYGPVAEKEKRVSTFTILKSDGSPTEEYTALKEQCQNI